jgi:hypothetical protein
VNFKLHRHRIVSLFLWSGLISIRTRNALFLQPHDEAECGLSTILVGQSLLHASNALSKLSCLNLLEALLRRSFLGTGVPQYLVRSLPIPTFLWRTLLRLGKLLAWIR